MAEPDDDEPCTEWTASRVVAHNMTRARMLRGLPQAEIAERLARYTGARWSQATVAQAEGSVRSTRTRQFTANELVALARTFDLPMLYFFMPPEDGRLGFAAPDSPAEGWSWEYLLMLVWGHRENFAVVAQRAAPWAHASPMLTEAGDDGRDGKPSVQRSAKGPRHRERFSSEDVAAMAFNGLIRQHMGDSIRSGEEMETLASHLEWLAQMLRAFDADPPGTYFDFDALRELAARKQRGG